MPCCATSSTKLTVAGKRLGVEYDAFGLRGHDALRLTASLEDFCTLEDASDLINLQRAIKSETEIDYVKRAAKLADQGFAKGLELVEPGAFEGDILAAMQAEILKEDGDYPGNEFVIGSGPAALLGRYTSGRRHLDKEDHITIELAGVYRHYHACIERKYPSRPTATRIDKHVRRCHRCYASCDGSHASGEHEWRYL